MPVFDGADGKAFPELLRHASIIDQFRIPYPRGPLEKPPAVDADPGRFRNTAFFTKMYGDCQKGEVSPHLVSLAWLPKTWGKSIRVTSVNGVDEHLRAVSAEIDALPEKIKRAAYPIAGTYNCRAVADTGQPSPHSYGIAIDLNTAFSDYWYWRPHGGPIVYRNRMPEEIVAIFEKHGFIWGGKWYHLRYDALRISTRTSYHALNPAIVFRQQHRVCQAPRTWKPNHGLHSHHKSDVDRRARGLRADRDLRQYCRL